MNAPLDKITTFMGTLPPEEYKLRHDISVLRDAASFKVTQTESADARTLCWMVTEWTSSWIWAPASVEALTEIVRLCRRLMKVADQFDLIEATLYER